MAWHQTGDKPFPETVLTKPHDAMWHHHASVSSVQEFPTWIKDNNVGSGWVH